jgi:hypothetical protein
MLLNDLHNSAWAFIRSRDLNTRLPKPRRRDTPLPVAFDNRGRGNACRHAVESFAAAYGNDFAAGISKDCAY